MADGQTRREFLRQVTSVLAGGTALGCQILASDTAASGQAPGGKTATSSHVDLKISNWTGDDFVLGHKFRDGDMPADFPPNPDKSVDFVIIGGGIAGLTTAYYLRDTNFLLLEQYEQLGGHSRGGSYRGIDYSWGPAFVHEMDGIFAQLYGDLGITAVKLAKDDNAFFFQQSWHKGMDSQQSNDLYTAFKRLIAETKPYRDKLPSHASLQSMSAPDLQNLDNIRFSELLKGYSPEFNALLQSFSKSETCGRTDQISGLAGLSLLEDLEGPKYVFKGGNPAITKALVTKINQSGSARLTSGAFVWQVKLTENGAKIFYSTADGATHHVDCKHVVLATPPMVAWRQLTNMDDKMKSYLMKFKYGAYLVANCLLNKKLFRGAYDNWLGSPFDFSNVVIAETPYELAGVYKPEMGSVLTAYRPWEPGSSGRDLLYAGDRHAFAKSTTEQLSQFTEHLHEHLEEIALTRWGHAIAVPGPGYFARLADISHNYIGPYTLAHNSTQGFPSAESAIRAAKFASSRALVTNRTSWLVPITLRG